MTIELLPLIFALVAALWGGWATLQGVKIKTKADSQASFMTALQNEVTRIRDSLEDRDKQAERNHYEIVALRSEVAQLHGALAELSVGSQALFHQVLGANMTPVYVPKPLVVAEARGESEANNYD